MLSYSSHIRCINFTLEVAEILICTEFKRTPNLFLRRRKVKKIYKSVRGISKIETENKKGEKATLNWPCSQKKLLDWKSC